jgi:2-polyprenyl-3-methyl-5-hydroxy-6-metoxy-1,4-benzoquinol methylase
MSNHCPLCTSLATKPSCFTKENNYYRCGDCGLFFLKTNHNANFDTSLQDIETAYLTYLSPKASDQRNHGQLLDWIQKYKKPEQNDFLDIGCGSGKFVRFLMNKNYKATGIEPSRVLYDQFLASESCFFQATTSQLLVRQPVKKYDVLTVFDVLEHVQQPMLFFKELAALMNPGGWLFISTPDSDSLHRKLTGKSWHYFNKYHFSLFNKTNLEMLAKRAGLALVSTRYFSRYFSIGYLKEYFNNFILRKKSSATRTKEVLVIPVNLYDNMYCVLRKPPVSKT